MGMETAPVFTEVPTWRAPATPFTRGALRTRRGGRSQITLLLTIPQWLPTATGVKSIPTFTASKALAHPITFVLRASSPGSQPISRAPRPLVIFHHPHLHTPFTWDFSKSLSFQFSLLIRKRTPQSNSVCSLIQNLPYLCLVKLTLTD